MMLVMMEVDVRNRQSEMTAKDERLHIEGKYEWLLKGRSPYFTDNPREACYLANKLGGMIINNHSNDPRECIEHDGIWRVVQGD